MTSAQLSQLLVHLYKLAIKHSVKFRTRIKIEMRLLVELEVAQAY